MTSLKIKKYQRFNVKIKRSSFQNLKKLKYENKEIPNSLCGSLSCVEFLGPTKDAIKYDMQ